MRSEENSAPAFPARIAQDKRTWDVAGTASEISLAQMSDALDLTDRASGSLHACKFTFRGEATNLREATATLWAEVTGLTWRDRTADTIMIGASLYNRQVQMEQLFVKQRNNQLTLSGESALPQKWSDWLNPDFRGDISASINDLGDFARLFGASPSDFAGKIDISGNVNAQERKLGGQLSASGNSLTLVSSAVRIAQGRAQSEGIAARNCGVRTPSQERFFSRPGEPGFGQRPQLLVHFHKLHRGYREITPL